LAIGAFVGAWFLLADRGKKLRLWVVPTFSLLVVFGNTALIVALDGPGEDYIPVGYAAAAAAEANGYDNVLEVEMTEGMRAVLSLPPNEANPQNLVLFDADGGPVHTNYNPATGMVDARIRYSGVYVLRE